MRSARLPLVAFTLAALLFATASFAQQAPKAEPRPLLVGVVDFGVVFKSYKRKDDLERMINAKKDGLETQYKAEAAAIQTLRSELDLLDGGSEEWREKRFQFQLGIKKMEVLREHMDEELKRAVENLTLMIVDEIEAVVRDYGKSHGFDLILKADSKGWGDERFQERIFRAQVTSAVYLDSKLDVTHEVLAALNDPEHLKKFR